MRRVVDSVSAPLAWPMLFGIVTVQVGVDAPSHADFWWASGTVSGDNGVNTGGSTCIITQGTPITIGDISVATAAANVGQIGGPLTLVGTPLIVVVSDGNYVTVNSALAGTSGLTKTGAGA